MCLDGIKYKKKYWSDQDMACEKSNFKKIIFMI